LGNSDSIGGGQVRGDARDCCQHRQPLTLDVFGGAHGRIRQRPEQHQSDSQEQPYDGRHRHVERAIGADWTPARRGALQDGDGPEDGLLGDDGFVELLREQIVELCQAGCGAAQSRQLDGLCRQALELCFSALAGSFDCSKACLFGLQLNAHLEGFLA
jgi:hypothetical protein